MSARKLSAADVLTLLEARAEGLRRVGVLVVAIDGFSAQLAPWSAPSQPERPAAPEPTYSDPLYDPATYPGGRVPGFDLDDDKGGMS